MAKEFIDNAQQLIHWMPLVTLIVGLITFSLGHFMGHRSAIRRDKRKEFNDISEPLLEYYEELLIQLEQPGYFSTTEFPLELLGKVERRLPSRLQIKFNRLFKDIMYMQNPKTEQERQALIIKIRCICKIIHLR